MGTCDWGRDGSSRGWGRGSSRGGGRERVQLQDAAVLPPLRLCGAVVRNEPEGGGVRQHVEHLRGRGEVLGF